MNTSLSIHDVISVDLGPIIDHLLSDGEAFTTREIIFSDRKGNKIEVKAFGETKDDLKLPYDDAQNPS